MHGESEIKMNPLNLTNRIMRKENYIIGMINEGIFNFNFKIPIINYEIDFFTKIIEWTIYLGVIDFIFDKNNFVKDDFLIESNKEVLISNLNFRLKLIGVLLLILSPFVLFFMLSYYIFRYGEEFRSHAGKLNSRDWNYYSKWNFREFNELGVVYNDRLNESYKYAKNYVSQFHSYSTNIISRFLYFISSSLLIALVFLTFYKEDYLTKLYISEGKTTLWYIGVLGTLLTIFKSTIFDENETFHPNSEMHF